MLIVSAFTFFGLSALQNISYFTDYFGDIKITINITTQEEENETQSSEVKEVKSKVASVLNSLAISGYNQTNAIAFKSNSLKLSKGHLKVTTPPPEAI
ncbi:MAG: hypothetical protein DWP98_03995 [Bacteroidetes bacterium]|nr:MAG: hypothetical protein DWP98_03995 [Bacteroidota bacterium]MBL1143387.1 hypothetical protein [Bacteroidota bacterium]MCB0802401.1 hypothetical protein [Flavobacteriales bacterium]NOG56190.1 hypothetical protein [Bacteroidota bacterium]